MCLQKSLMFSKIQTQNSVSRIHILSDSKVHKWYVKFSTYRLLGPRVTYIRSTYPSLTPRPMCNWSWDAASAMGVDKNCIGWTSGIRDLWCSDPPLVKSCWSDSIGEAYGWLPILLPDDIPHPRSCAIWLSNYQNLHLNIIHIHTYYKLTVCKFNTYNLLKAKISNLTLIQ